VGGGSRPCSSSKPDFSITTWPLSPPGTAGGIFGCGDAVGAGTAIACGGGGVGLSDGTRDCSGVGLGLFSGFGVSLASEVAFALPFAVFFGVGDAFFRLDFFFPAFAFGVGLGDFFAFRKAVVGSGVSLGFGFGVVSSSSLDFFAAFAFAIGLGDSSGPADAPVSSLDLCSTRFAFAIGLGDLFGVGDEVRCVVCLFSDAFSRLPSSSLLTCARRRLPTIALSASAVASQRRKRTTAAERNRARGAINSRKRLLRESIRCSESGWACSRRSSPGAPFTHAFALPAENRI
jgi:hypothetical protein